MTTPATQFELHHQDCVEGMRLLPEDSVDVVMTSPPYNLGINYSKFNDTMKRGAYLAWAGVWAREIYRVLKPQGSFFLNIGAAPANPLLPHQLAINLSEIFALQNTIHWVKSITVETRAGEMISTGHFKPIQSPRYLTDCHEYVFHFTRDGDVPVHRLAVGVPYADKSNIARWGHTNGRDKRCRGNNWFVPYATIQRRKDERPHPATFPVGLAEMCIRLHGIDKIEGGGVVMDPFLGIGHAALAARECGAARFIGYEIDEGYLAEAHRRVSSPREVTHQPHLFPQEGSKTRTAKAEGQKVPKTRSRSKKPKRHEQGVLEDLSPMLISVHSEGAKPPVHHS
jgi:site-specific DNA-methyltransferase (adenine-specific)